MKKDLGQTAAMLTRARDEARDEMRAMALLLGKGNDWFDETLTKVMKLSRIMAMMIVSDKDFRSDMTEEQIKKLHVDTLINGIDAEILYIKKSLIKVRKNASPPATPP